METRSFNGRGMAVHELGNKDADYILLQPIDGHDMPMIESEFKTIRLLTSVDFGLITISVNDWNGNLSPWEAPAVFGQESFGGGSAELLQVIMNVLYDKRKHYVMGGYSMAGLFALWAGYQTDAFEAVAAASPSVWFPGFTEYMENKDVKAKTVYLSLGDREAKTKNPIMSTVEDRIQESYRILKRKGVRVTLEWNKGNHFKDVDTRMANAFAWVLNQGEYKL